MKEQRSGHVISVWTHLRLRNYFDCPSHRLVDLTVPKPMLIPLQYANCYIYKVYTKCNGAHQQDLRMLQSAMRVNITTFKLKLDKVVHVINGGFFPHCTFILPSFVSVVFTRKKKPPKLAEEAFLYSPRLFMFGPCLLKDLVPPLQPYQGLEGPAGPASIKQRSGRDPCHSAQTLQLLLSCACAWSGDTCSGWWWTWGQWVIQTQSKMYGGSWYCSSYLGLAGNVETR